MIKAVLLDLDNTMVLFDETGFYLRYMERITPFFDGLVPDGEFANRLLRAIRDLRLNDGETGNRDHFLDVFCRGIEDRRQEIWQHFMEFYRSEYDRIPVSAVKPDGLERVLDQLVDWGLELIVATNPIFPEVAQEKRMGWVDIDRDRFTMVTHIDNMRYVKPRSEYYRQICDMIATPPEACLMVGNDAINDIVAGTVGLKTYMTTEAGVIDYSAVTKGRKVRIGEKHAADFSGPLKDVLGVVEKLNSC